MSNIKITLPDKSVKEVSKGITPQDIASLIGPGLSKAVVVSKVDGVLTDGSIFTGSDGAEFKKFNVEDGAGAAFARLASIPIVLISGRESKSTTIRACELKIDHCFQGSLDKTTPYKEVCKIYNVVPENIAYIGDGLIDIVTANSNGLNIIYYNSYNKK